MRFSRTSADPRHLLAATLLAAGAVAVGGTVVGGANHGGDRAPSTHLGEAPPASRPAVPAEHHAALPAWISIPAISTRSDLLRLGINADHTLQVPADDHAGEAGWYRYSPRPGERGPAVVVGHVDSLDGPAVFYHLSEVRPGDRVLVGRRDGSVVRFRVTAVRVVDKAHFATDAVYGDTAGAELRIITCGGTYDPDAGGYQANVVVFASKIRSGAAGGSPGRPPS